MSKQITNWQTSLYLSPRNTDAENAEILAEVDQFANWVRETLGGTLNLYVSGEVDIALIHFKGNDKIAPYTS